jgi:hypothetical protein
MFLDALCRDADPQEELILCSLDRPVDGKAPPTTFNSFLVWPLGHRILQAEN